VDRLIFYRYQGHRFSWWSRDGVRPRATLHSRGARHCEASTGQIAWSVDSLPRMFNGLDARRTWWARRDRDRDAFDWLGWLRQAPAG
jgi:hypothetical protein